jgi:hypothetical protein
LALWRWRFRLGAMGLAFPAARLTGRRWRWFCGAQMDGSVGERAAAVLVAERDVVVQLPVEFGAARGEPDLLDACAWEVLVDGLDPVSPCPGADHAGDFF